MKIFTNCLDTGAAEEWKTIKRERLRGDRNRSENNDEGWMEEKEKEGRVEPGDESGRKR